MAIFTVFGMAFYVIATPVTAFIFLKTNFKRLKEENFNGRFGSLYMNLKASHFSKIFQVIMFFGRRLIFAFSIVYYGDVPLLQASI